MLGGRYTLLNELGTGGMAVVWRARDEVLGRSVAVKLLAGRYAGDPQSRARIRDEARAAATLSHPNIAQVYDFGESDENGHFLSYVVMELVHGITLQQRVKSGMLAPKQIFHIGAQVASALAAAHADGLVHRDIKPANVMVTQDGAKVVDFGIAAAVGPGDPRDEVLGTPAYLAPERLTGDAVEAASDVYALGVLLYRLLAGESPWTVDSTTQMLEAHVYVEPAPLPSLPEVPAEVTSLINRCLRKDTAGRPTAGEVSAVLAGAADNRPGLLPAPDRGERSGLSAAPGGKSGSLPRAREGHASSGGSVPRNGSAAGEKPLGLMATSVAEGEAGPATAPGVRPVKRKRLVAAGAAAVLVVGVAAWMLVPAGGAEGEPGGTVAVLPSAPASTTGLGGPAGDVTKPAVVAPESTRTSATAVPTASGSAPEPSEAASSSSAPGTGNGSGPGNGTGPGPGTDEPTPSPSGTPTEAGPPPAVKTFTSPGGTVEARCNAAGKAKLVAWAAKNPYKVERVSAGPALAAVIVFKRGVTRIRTTVTCVGGDPVAVTLPL
jgi:hypothetical protein